MDVDMDMDRGSFRDRLGSGTFRGSLTSSESFSGTSSGSPGGAAAHEHKFRVYEEALRHASTCTDKLCTACDGRCHKIKASIDHFVRCYGPRRKQTPIESCPNCSRIWGLLCYHAKHCSAPHGQRCVVSQCDYLREKIARKLQQDQEELQRAQQVLRDQEWPVERRMAQLEADRQQVMLLIQHIRAEKEARQQQMAL